MEAETCVICLQPILFRVAISASPHLRSIALISFSTVLPQVALGSLLSFTLGAHLRVSLGIILWDIFKMCPSRRRRRLLFYDALWEFIWKIQFKTMQKFLFCCFLIPSKVFYVYNLNSRNIFRERKDWNNKILKMQHKTQKMNKDILSV